MGKGTSERLYSQVCGKAVANGFIQLQKIFRLRVRISCEIDTGAFAKNQADAFYRRNRKTLGNFSSIRQQAEKAGVPGSQPFGCYQVERGEREQEGESEWGAKAGQES